MSELKKSPFNGFKPCIGNECAFFLEPVHVNPIAMEWINKDELMIDPKDISFPCSFTLTGKVAFLSHRPQAKNVQKLPWDRGTIFHILSDNLALIRKSRGSNVSAYFIHDMSYKGQLFRYTTGS